MEWEDEMTEWWAFLWKCVRKKTYKKAVIIKPLPKKKWEGPPSEVVWSQDKNGYKNEKHSFIMPGDGECSVTAHSYVCFTFQCFSFQSKGKQVGSC